MKQTIHQLLAGFRRGDAISNAALLMQSVFRAWGCRSEIVCERSRISSEIEKSVCDFETASKELGRDDVAILHLSIGCGINRRFADLPCRKVIVYHNVTPSSYFRFLNPAVAADLEEGRRQVARLAGVAEINLADSHYNARELIDAGYENVGVLQLPINIDALRPGHSAPNLLSRFSDGLYNVLFVGRMVPNKKIEDLLTVMHFLHAFEPRARFIHVGAISGSESYFSLVQAHAKALILENCVFLGSVSQAELNACYEVADAFLCMSEHEGFCAPLIESMLHRIPVLSLASAAIPETLAGAGILFQPPPDFPVIAEMLGEVLHNKTLRDAVVARQDKRVAEFCARDLDADLRKALAPVLQ